MKKHVKEYTLHMYNGTDTFNVSDVAYIFNCARKDGVMELHMNKHHYETISYFMVGCGAWNWDNKTFMGITLVVENDK